MPARAGLFLYAALFAATALPAFLSASFTARAADADTARAETLAKVEAYMNALSTLQSNFVQLSSNGLFAEGEMAISKPGKLRMDYAPPTPVRLISDGSFLVHWDMELDQFSHIPLFMTPAALLLDENLSFADPDITVTGLEHKDGVITVTVTQTDDPEEGSLTLIFTDAPMQLRKWRVVDAEGIATDVTLLDPRTGMKLDEDMFDPPVYQPKSPQNRNN